MMLFDTPKTGVSIDTDVLWTTLLGVGSFLTAITYLATRATLSRPKSGTEAPVAFLAFAMGEAASPEPSAGECRGGKTPPWQKP